MTGPTTDPHYGEAVRWSPQPPRPRLVRLLVSWLVAAIAVLVSAEIVPGVSVHGFGGALVAASLIAVLNAFLPPLVAALRLPFTLALGFKVEAALHHHRQLADTHLCKHARRSNGRTLRSAHP